MKIQELKLDLVKLHLYVLDVFLYIISGILIIESPNHLFPTAPVLQHASHLLPVLEPPPARPRQHLPLPLPAAGLPLADPGGPRPHAAAAHLASALLLLPPGDVRPHGLLPVARAHVGAGPQPAAGVPRLDVPGRSAPRQQQERLAVLTVDPAPLSSQSIIPANGAPIKFFFFFFFLPLIHHGPHLKLTAPPTRPLTISFLNSIVLLDMHVVVSHSLSTCVAIISCVCVCNVKDLDAVRVAAVG